MNTHKIYEDYKQFKINCENLNSRNIWICPAQSNNLYKTIINKYKNEYLWAMNAKQKNQFNKLKNNDICLFGSLRQNRGLEYMGIVNAKRIIDETDDEWPYKSPSGTHWKHVFTLSSIYEINISPTKARELRGWNKKQSWQTQTNITVEMNKKEFIDYLCYNYPDYIKQLI